MGDALIPDLVDRDDPDHGRFRATGAPCIPHVLGCCYSRSKVVETSSPTRRLHALTSGKQGGLAKEKQPACLADCSLTTPSICDGDASTPD